MLAILASPGRERGERLLLCPRRAQFASNYARCLIAGGVEQSAKRFIDGFVTEFKGAVVHGQEIRAAGLCMHLPHLFRACVGVDPGVVGADAEDTQIERS